MRRTRISVVGSIAVMVVAGLTGTAQAGGGQGRDTEVVEAQDDCHPRTFNEFFGPGWCVGDGDTTLEEAFEEFEETGEVDKWRFHPDDTHIDHGDRLVVKNVGGERHTWTPKGGADGVVLAPGQRIRVDDLEPGTHEFFCEIHPWMEAEVEVRRG